MKTLTAAVAKRNFSKVLEDVQDEDVVVTRHGRPVARIQSASRGAGYWEEIGRRIEGPSRPIDEFWEEIGVPKSPNLKYKYPPARARSGKTKKAS